MAPQQIEKQRWPGLGTGEMSDEREDYQNIFLV